MTPQPERALAAVLRDMILERQRLLIREANYLRGLVGLPPVSARGEQSVRSTAPDGRGSGQRRSR